MSKSLVLTPVETVACCSTMTRDPLSADQAGQVSTLLKALADPVRLRLMSLVLSHEDGEACVCTLVDAFELSQPTISHHLKVLHEAGLLERDKRGVWVYYRARQDALDAIAALLSPGPAAAVGPSPNAALRPSPNAALRPSPNAKGKARR